MRNSIELLDVGALEKAKLTDREKKLITARMITVVLKKYRTHGASKIAKSEGANVAGFKRVRVKNKRFNRLYGSLWFGGNSIQARFFGRLRNSGDGAFAGRHFVKGAFKATMKSGFTSLFKRKKSGKGIEQVLIALPQFDNIIKKEVETNKPIFEETLRGMIMDTLRKR